MGSRDSLIHRVWMEGNLKWLLAVALSLGGGALALGSLFFASLPPAAALLPLLLLTAGIFLLLFGGLKKGLFLKPHWQLTDCGKAVALTFDDGPHPVHTPAILAALRSRGVRATFFLLGRAAAKTHLVRDIVAGGHEIGSHGFSHRNLRLCGPQALSAEIDGTESLLRESGAPNSARIFRPPHGAKSPLLERALRKRGLRLVTWSLTAKDWKGLPAAVTAERLLKSVRPGAIILMHDGPEAATVLPLLLEGLLGEGYIFLTVSEGLTRP